MDETKAITRSAVIPSPWVIPFMRALFRDRPGLLGRRLPGESPTQEELREIRERKASEPDPLVSEVLAHLDPRHQTPERRPPSDPRPALAVLHACWAYRKGRGVRELVRGRSRGHSPCRFRLVRPAAPWLEPPSASRAPGVAPPGARTAAPSGVPSRSHPPEPPSPGGCHRLSSRPRLRRSPDPRVAELPGPYRVRGRGPWSWAAGLLQRGFKPADALVRMASSKIFQVPVGPTTGSDRPRA